MPPYTVLSSAALTHTGDTSGTAMNEYCLELGRWWQMDLAGEVQERLRVHKQDQEDLSIHGLELLGMIITAWAFVGPAGTRPQYGGGSLLPNGDNMSAIHWVNL